MLKIRKILGILLAACFVLSVTIASVSAAPQQNNGQWGDKNKGYNQNNWDKQGNNWDKQRSNWDSQRGNWDKQKRDWDGQRNN